MTTTKQKTAVIYARVSDLRKEEDTLPIESQIDAAQKKAEALSVQVLRIFRDDGISGRDAGNRPAFQDAIAFCAAFDIDYFICWSTSRFARNKLDAANYKRLLRRGGTETVYVSMDIDPNTHGGWLLESIMEVVDEHQSRTISHDTRRSMLKNAREGYFNGGRVPFGYKAVMDGKRKRLAIQEDDATVVRIAFKLAASGLGAKAIAMQLNEQGSTRDAKPWSRNQVANMLKSEVYAGLTVFGRVRHDGTDVDEENWVRTPSHEAIIPPAEFDRIQNLIQSRDRNGKTSAKSTYVFTGLLRCAACGSAMQIETATGRSKTYSYYNCRSALQGTGCTNRRYPAREVDAYLTDVIMGRILTPQRVRDAITEIHKAAGQIASAAKGKTQALQRELGNLRSRRKNLFDILELHGKDAPNLGDLTARLRELNDQIKNAERAVDGLGAYDEVNLEISDAKIANASGMIRKIIEQCEDVSKKRGFFSSFMDRIVIGDDIQIEYQPDKVLNRHHLVPVQSGIDWLPDLDSNQGPAD
jgi:site-specific DNA recombinase